VPIDIKTIDCSAVKPRPTSHSALNTALSMAARSLATELWYSLTKACASRCVLIGPIFSCLASSAPASRAANVIEPEASYQIASYARLACLNNCSWNGLATTQLVSGVIPWRFTMKLTIIALSAVALVASSPAVFAQGVSAKAPGQEMQAKGSVRGTHGASGYAPGHIMQRKGSKIGTHGASGYAPGQTTGMAKSK